MIKTHALSFLFLFFSSLLTISNTKDELTLLLLGSTTSLKCFQKFSDKASHNFLYHPDRDLNLSKRITLKSPQYNEKYTCYEQLKHHTSLSNSHKITATYFLKTKGCDEKSCLHGLCDSSNLCYCLERYTTWEADPGVECNYHQKSRFGAFLLEFFFGMEFGIGYFYLGKTTLGILQMLMFLPAMIIFCCISCCCVAMKPHISPQMIVFGICFIVTWFLAVFGWWIYAVVGMGTGIITESNGAPTSDHLYL